MQCQACGANLPDRFSNCPFCGEPLNAVAREPGADDVLEQERAFVAPLFRFPPVTVAIMVINLVVFLLLEARGGSTNEVLLLVFGAKARSLVFHGEWWRLVTASFLHIGWLHLVVNSLTLIQLGMVCENLFGRARLVVLHVLSGAGGFLLSAVMTDTISAGASASLAGLMGALLVFGFRSYRRIPPSLRRHFTWYLLPWVAVMLGLGMFYRAIDNWAHLGGLLAGAALGLLLDTRLSPSPPSRVTRVVQGVAFAATCLVSLSAGYHGVVGARDSLELLGPSAGGRDELGEIEVLSRFLDADPGDAFLHYLRGEARYRAGRLPAAEKDYRAALASGYGSAAVKNALAWVLALNAAGDDPALDEALRLARAAVREERAAAYLNTLGWVYFVRGDYLAAVAQLEAAYRRASRATLTDRVREVLLPGNALLALLAESSGWSVPRISTPPTGERREEMCLDLYMLSLAYDAQGDGETARARFAAAEALWVPRRDGFREAIRFRELALATFAQTGAAEEKGP